MAARTARNFMLLVEVVCVVRGESLEKKIEKWLTCGLDVLVLGGCGGLLLC